MRAATLGLIALFIAAAAPAQTPTGEPVEGLTCASDATQSYTLYLPSTFDPARQWPLLLVFDPRGRSVEMVELFRGAAEEYGWMLIASNDTRSDSGMEPNRRAVNALWLEINNKYPVDPRRIYAAGFSGTVYVAAALGKQTGELAGVIGAGGRFIDRLYPGTTFPFFGAVGTLDFNYPEMLELDEFLARNGNAHRLEVFDGPHQWMPEPVARQAVEWLELEAMRRSLRSRDDDLISRLFASDVAAAELLESAGEAIAALRRYRAIERTFDRLHPTTEVARRADRLEAGPEYRRESKEHAKWLSYEEKYLNRLTATLREFRDEPPRTASQLSRDLRIGELERRASGDGFEAVTAQRLLHHVVTIVSFYLTRELLEKRMYGHAAAALEVATDIRDDNPVVWYNLACALARTGQQNAALDALERSVETGFTDAEHIVNDPDLSSLRGEDRFRSVVERLRAEN
jgi:predicted esterase